MRTGSASCSASSKANCRPRSAVSIMPASNAEVKPTRDISRKKAGAALRKAGMDTTSSAFITGSIAAPSTSHPVGTPSSSRWKKCAPGTGSGDSEEIPAIARAMEFAQAVWPPSSIINAGRSDTIWSNSLAVGPSIPNARAKKPAPNTGFCSGLSAMC